MYFAVNLIIFIFEPLPVYFLDNRSRFMKLRIPDNGCERARSKIKSIVQAHLVRRTDATRWHSVLVLGLSTVL